MPDYGLLLPDIVVYFEFKTWEPFNGFTVNGEMSCWFCLLFITKIDVKRIGKINYGCVLHPILIDVSLN